MSDKLQFKTESEDAERFTSIRLQSELLPAGLSVFFSVRLELKLIKQSS